ncbi:MAG: TIGR03111 family XrtG-associated glycosyltransferase [Liquorilactobacillus sp.]|jgi:putative glycosyltransferase (exosortase G-associated)|uniref:TIGR03111 family XrtG-associated glycosyltransferase n=1 Tax=Liquorilactobacillus nagelii TaxID=82688 RepID=UPI0039EAB173
MIKYWVDLTILKMGFWITWTLIPVVVEIFPALISAFRVLYRYYHRQKLVQPIKLPFITVIIPVYNSADTLFQCIRSIAYSSYPVELIQVIIADNQSTDDSFLVFNQAQKIFDQLNMQIIQTEKGKAQALNSSLYAAIGKYIVNIDSDGILKKDALMNIVLHFENDHEISALTGTILPNKDLINNLTNTWQRQLAKNEYFEYAQAFLSGRTIESERNELFTMSGAFSAFRKDDLMQTFLYNTATVGEDTDMTFQLRQRLKKKVILCADAIFYIEPISGWGELYTQRQRWFRGEIETSKNFSMDNQFGLSSFFKNFLVRRLMIDHTFMFPRMIWFFASFVLLFFRYSPVIMMISYFAIYVLYIFVSILNYICVRVLLRPFPDEKAYYSKLWWVVLTFPIYNLINSIIRLIGSINLITRPTKWNAEKFSVERKLVYKRIRMDLKSLKRKKG